MEQQLTEMLELLKNGLAEIPEYGTQLWNVLVKGTRAGGFVQVVLMMAILFLFFVALKFTYKKHSAEMKKRYSERTDFWEVSLVILLVALAVTIVISTFFFYTGAMDMLVPEYQIINQVINMIGS